MPALAVPVATAQATRCRVARGMGDSVSKSDDRLYRGTQIDYKDRNGEWHVARVSKVDDTRGKEAIVVVCPEARELQYFLMSSKSSRGRISRLGDHTVNKKDDLLEYAHGVDEAELPEDSIAKYHSAILGKRRSSFDLCNQPELILRRRNPSLNQTKFLHRTLLKSLDHLYRSTNASGSNYAVSYRIGQLVDFFGDDLRMNVTESARWRPAKILDIEHSESIFRDSTTQKKIKVHILGTPTYMDSWIELPGDAYRISEFLSRSTTS